MSTKKDKFSIKDKFYMELALDLAKSREGLTGPNPSVGCVIVKNDELISIGQTSYNGYCCPNGLWRPPEVPKISAKWAFEAPRGSQNKCTKVVHLIIAVQIGLGGPQRPPK